jgi:general secretion pathway protein L
MAEMKKNYPSTINILRELTQVIPETAWVVSLNYSNKKITIQGEAESATSVIEAIENSPMFREVRFSSPVTRSGPVDRFTLEAEVVS